MNRRTFCQWILSAAFVAVALVPRPAAAVVVERVVAVIGQKAVLLSDLNKRARPLLLRLNQQCPLGSAPCIPAENRIKRELLQKMVNEELERQAAIKAKVNVTAEDVDRIIARIARMAGRTVAELYGEIATQGFTQAEYRQDIRRQVLEGKLVNRLVQNQTRITPEELKSEYRNFKRRERKVLLYQVSWLVLRVGEKPNPTLVASRMAEAQDLVARARAGADFAQLVKQHSDDERTRDRGGDLEVRAPAGSPYLKDRRYNTLAAPLEKVARGLNLGQVSAPFRFQGGVVVMKLTNRQPSRFPSYQAARREMARLVQNKKLEQVKSKWLKGLRRRTHVDVRL
jgi:peptidyl-prolyl cis-trans isomerase SurA